MHSGVSFICIHQGPDYYTALTSGKEGTFAELEASGLSSETASASISVEPSADWLYCTSSADNIVCELRSNMKTCHSWSNIQVTTHLHVLCIGPRQKTQKLLGDGFDLCPVQGARHIFSRPWGPPPCRTHQVLQDKKDSNVNFYCMSSYVFHYQHWAPNPIKEASWFFWGGEMERKRGKKKERMVSQYASSPITRLTAIQYSTLHKRWPNHRTHCTKPQRWPDWVCLLSLENTRMVDQLKVTKWAQCSSTLLMLLMPLVTAMPNLFPSQQKQNSKSIKNF